MLGDGCMPESEEHPMKMIYSATITITKKKEVDSENANDIEEDKN